MAWWLKMIGMFPFHSTGQDWSVYEQGTPNCFLDAMARAPAPYYAFTSLCKCVCKCVGLNSKELFLSVQKNTSGEKVIEI